MLSRIILLVLFLSASVFAQLVYSNTERLPKNVKPIRYFLTINPRFSDMEDRRKLIFEGSVTIELEILENTTNITLNQRGLSINSSSVVIIGSNGEEIRPSRTEARWPIYAIQLDKELLKNEKYNLTIGNFQGKSVEPNYLLGGHGFFPVKYNRYEDSSRTLAVAHFESFGASATFPCFDEPDIKAKFIISLIREEEYATVSNEQVRIIKDLGNGLFKNTFKETPPMSTSNVAFAILDLKSKKIGRHRIFGTGLEINQGKADAALEISGKTLPALEEYTGIDFPLKQLVQFGVSSDSFPKTANANWGLIVHSGPESLLINPSSAEDYQRCACVIADKFAQQWFGNLVTSNYVWLDKSFATYFGYYIAGVIQPTWRMMEQFVIEATLVGLTREDPLKNAFSLNMRVQNQEVYDQLSYKKGASVVRMTEHFVTHDVFKKAIRAYLNDNKFGVTRPLDLYNALQEAVDDSGVNNLLQNITVTEVLETWTSNKGYPVVTVKRDYKTGLMTLEQSSRTEDNSEKWIVPINYVFSSSNDLDFTKTTADYWLTKKRVAINNHFPTDGWVILNKQQTGYYRVNYDSENWERIINFLNTGNFSLIHPLNKAQLINDALTFAFNEILPWDVPLRLCEYLVRERDYIPLVAFKETLHYYTFNVLKSNNLHIIFKVFKDYATSKGVQRNSTHDDADYWEYSRNILSGIRTNLGLKEKSTDTHLDKLLRSKIK